MMKYARRWGWGFARIGIANLLLCCAAMAQAPPDRLFAAPDDSTARRLQAVVETLRLALPGHSRPEVLLTQLGQLYLRLDKPDSAIAAFEQALAADSTRMQARVGLGRAFWEYKDDPKKARDVLKKAVAVDSTSAEAHYTLARVYIDLGDRNAAGIHTRAALRHDPRMPAAYLLMAQLFEADGAHTTAMAYYDRYLALDPEQQTSVYGFVQALLSAKRYDALVRVADRTRDPRVLPMLGSALLARRDYEAALSVFKAYIDRLPADEQALYDDISLVGLPREVEAYRRTSPQTRERFLRQFWLRHDPFKTSGGTMRRAEHYRRVWHARMAYGQKAWPFDRRGEVYVRYGEPDYRSTWRQNNANVPPKVERIQAAMAFQLYGEDATGMNFTGPVFPVKTAIVEELDDRGFGEQSQPIQILKALGMERYRPVYAGANWATVPWEVWVYADIDNGMEVVFTDDFHSGKFDYAPVPTPTAKDIDAIMTTRDGSMRRMTERLEAYAPAQRMAHVAQSTPERYDVQAYDPLDFYYETAAFRGDNGLTDLQVNIGVPVAHVVMPGDGDTTVVIDRRASLVDSTTAVAVKARAEVSVPVAGGALHSNTLAMDRVDLMARPGDYRLAVQVGRRNTNRLQVYQETVQVPDFQQGLGLSDLLLAQKVTEAAPGTDPAFVRNEWQIVPSPSRAFFSGDPMFAYFEIYNLTKDEFGATHYEITFHVHAQTGDSQASLLQLVRRADGQAVSVQYAQSGNRETVTNYVELNIGTVPPGSYVVRMTVRDLNAQKEVRRERLFRVLAPK